MKEEKEVNFLPDELKPKKIKERKDYSEIEYSSPKESNGSLLNNNGNKKTKAGLWSIFKLKKKDTDETDDVKGPMNLAKPAIKKSNVNKARKELLEKIKEQTVRDQKKLFSPKVVADKEKVKIDLIGDPLKNKKIPLRQGILPDRQGSEGQVKKPIFSFISDWSQARHAKKEEQRQKKNMARIAKQTAKKIKSQSRSIRTKVKSMTTNDEKKSKEEKIEQTKPVRIGSLSVAGQQEDDILITNLIKGQEFTFFNWRQAIIINIISVLLTVLIIGAGWGYLTWKISQQEVTLSKAQKEAIMKQTELLAIEKEIDEIDNLRVKTKEVKNILDKHIYWTNFFTYLENNTLPEVHYKKFIGDLTFEYKIPGSALSFDSYIAQMENWQKDNEYTITAKSSGAKIIAQTGADNPGKIAEFDLELKVDPKIFLKN